MQTQYAVDYMQTRTMTRGLHIARHKSHIHKTTKKMRYKQCMRYVIICRKEKIIFAIAMAEIEKNKTMQTPTPER